MAAAADSLGAAAAEPVRVAEAAGLADVRAVPAQQPAVLELARCSGAHVLEFLRYLDQIGKTKVHAPRCPFFSHPSPPAPCPCPLKQAWGSLDALPGRLHAAFEEHGCHPEVCDSQAKTRGIACEKKRRKHHLPSHRQAAAGRQPASPPPKVPASPPVRSGRRRSAACCRGCGTSCRGGRGAPAVVGPPAMAAAALGLAPVGTEREM